MVTQRRRSFQDFLEETRAERVARVFRTRGVQGLIEEGLIEPPRPPQEGGGVSPLEALKRLARGAAALPTGAVGRFPEAAATWAGGLARTGAAFVPGEQGIERRARELEATGVPRPLVSEELARQGLDLPSGRLNVLAALLGGPGAGFAVGDRGPGPSMPVGLQGFLEATTPVPFAGAAAPVVRPMIGAGVRGAQAGIRAARPAVAEAMQKAAPVARRVAAAEAGAARIPGGAAKEPWQMTKAKFVEAQVAQEKGEFRTSWSKSKQLGDMHKVSVGRALSEGKPVPPEVLADYPDLAVAAGQAEMPVVRKRPTIAEQEAARLERAKQQLDALEVARERAAARPMFKPGDSVLVMGDERIVKSVEVSPSGERLYRVEGLGQQVNERQVTAAGQAEMPVAAAAKPVAEPAPGLPIPGVREPTEAVTPRVEIPIESVRRIERTIQQADDIYGQRLSQARAEFEQATASARAAFEQVDRPAFEAYHQALSQGIPESQARAAYSRATAPALATYQETLLPAQSAMMEKTAAIGRAFDQARARIKPDLLAVEEAAQQLRPGVERPIPGIRGVTETAVERGPGERLVAEPEVARARLEEARAAAAAGAPPIKPPIEPPVPPVATGAVPPEEPFAANIRLSKYPEDIRATIKDWANTHPTEVQAARRGVRSDAQVLADAQRLVEGMGGDFTKLQKRWKPGEAWNAEEITAIRGVLRAKAEAALEAAKATTGVDSTVNQARLVLAIEDAVRAQEVVHGVTAEAGRALRSFRQQAFDAIESGDAGKMQEIIRRLGGKAKVDEYAAALAQLDINDPIAVNNFLQNATKPGLADYIIEVFYNSILSGPKTHIINALSNTATAFLSPVERGAGAAVEQVLARLQGRPVERFFAEVPADVIGAIQGIKEGSQAGLYTLRTGIRPSAASKWEFRPHAFRGKLGRGINAPSTALEAADALGYAVNYQAALEAGTIRAAKATKLQGQLLTDRIAELTLNPPPEVIKEAARIAEYRLFRQEPGEVVSQLMRFRDIQLKLWQGGPTVPNPVRFVIPFLRTPINLLKFGLERSPVGVVNPQLWRNLASKNPAASDQIARIFIGSTLAAAIAWWFAEGRITGRAPSSAAERDRFYREGKQAYAVQIGDRWVQYQRLEPYNQTLSQIAAAVEAIQDKDKTGSGKVSQAIFSLSENLVSQTYLSNLSGLINALSQPERYGPQWLTRFATGFMPASSLLRTAGQVTDPTVRKPKTILEAMAANIPGLAQVVPASLTAFGEEAKRQGLPWFPISVTRAQQSAVDAELERLGVEVGFVGTTIGGVPLSREQQQRYQILAGQESYKALSVLVGRSFYNSGSDAYKEAQIRRITEGARETARRALSGPSALRPSRAEMQAWVSVPGP